MYFLDIAHEVTGGSLGTYASDLSHLIRYCGVNNVGIEYLNDAHFHALSKQLLEERSPRHPLERARDNNTVRTILSRAIQFLLWYQKTLMPHLLTPLIGEQSVSPQIIVKRVKHNPEHSKGGNGGYYYTHAAMPPRKVASQSAPSPARSSKTYNEPSIDKVSLKDGVSHSYGAMPTTSICCGRNSNTSERGACL